MRRPLWILCACLVWLATTATAVTSDDAFPTVGIMPKQETGAAQFIEQHPKYDGRGAVVAVFDTGVDPGTAGLLRTSDGRPKIVDLVDATGDGDVDTSTVRKLDDGTIEGLTGRRLSIPKKWKNPGGEFHVGVKRAYELFPSELVDRLKKKRGKAWQARQREAVTALTAQIAEWDAAHPKPTPEQKRLRNDLAKRLELLHEAGKEFDDPGPVFDCVVFHDGRRHVAAIDTDEDGQLDDEKLLTNYRDGRRFATFGDEDLLNFAVNIYDEGRLLSIVTDCGRHGTHVAGIVAACYPDRPEMNGVAPGAQIVSVKIGDSRAGTSSTHTGTIRGLAAVLANRCDLINMSYGGASPVPQGGRISELLAEIVNKHGVIFVASAGNNGPALSTVGTPGGTTSALLGVGAYVSPAMMKIEYSLRRELPEMPFTWSSRGPTLDGHLGVDICAPGAAISPVPNWALQRNMLMNGTSMAAPNACGGLALLLSGLKAEQIDYSPHTVRRAVVNTARQVETGSVFAHGHGLLQVSPAFDYLKQHADAENRQVRFEVDLPERSGARGLYLREPHESRQVVEPLVRVRPVFHEDADPRGQVDFEMRVALESTVPWIETPDHLMLMHGGRRFRVQVDPTELDGGVSYGEVLGYDAERRERGVLFRLPVTVVRPEPWPGGSPPDWNGECTLTSGELARRFLEVPPGATWTTLTVGAGPLKAPRRLVVHAVQLTPRTEFSKHSVREFFTLRPQGKRVLSFPVLGGRTLELCIGQYWSTLDEGQYQLKLEFHGLTPSRADVGLDGSLFAERIDVAAPLRDEQLAPSAALDTLRTSHRPGDALIRPVPGPRDTLPEQRRIHELVLDYPFELSESAKVSPRPAISANDESWLDWESQLWMLYDESKQLIASECEPTPVKLEKGKYTLRFHLRHDDPKRLARLEQMPLLLDRSLAKPLTLRLHRTYDAAVQRSASVSNAPLHRGNRLPLFLAAPVADKLPATAKQGQLLLGKLTLAKPDGQINAAHGQPIEWGLPLTYLVPSKPQPDDEDAEPAKDDAKSLAEQLSDARLAHLAALRTKNDRKAFDRLAKQLADELRDPLPALVEQLKMADEPAQRAKRPLRVAAAADRVVARIDTRRLATWKGKRHDLDDPEIKKQQQEMDRQQATLIDALHRKARAAALIEPPAKSAEEDAFEAAFAQLAEWADTTDVKYADVHVVHARRQNRLGEALDALDKRIADSPHQRDLYEQRIELYESLGWSHLVEHERRQLLVRFPSDYLPF